MQKRYLIIFSLLVVSVLFIAGCQEAVGNLRRQVSYSVTDSTYSTDKLGLESIAMAVKDTCDSSGAPYVYLTYTPSNPSASGKDCYEVRGCVNLQAKERWQTSPEEPKSSFIKEIPIVVKSGSEIPCAQNSRGSLRIMSYDEVLILN